MKTNEKKKLLIGVVVIALLGLLALLHQRGLFPFKKFIAGQVREEGNEIRVTTPDEVFDEDGNPLVNGDCSLFEAFRAATTNMAVDACPAGLSDVPDIIILQENTTYRPRPVRNAASAFNITGKTVLEGNGSIIEGGGENEREFRMISSRGPLTLKNLTIKDFRVSGNGQRGRGGAVYVFSGTSRIDNCTFVNNSAQWGGAIYIHGSSTTTTITHSTFTGNSAFGGGALYLEGTVELRSSTVSNNVSSGDGGGVMLRGAALFNDIPLDQQPPGRLIIEESFITSNSAGGQGGGIFNVGQEKDLNEVTTRLATTLVINHSSVNNNTAGSGGGIANGGHTVINNSSIIGNQASQHGGIGWFYSSVHAPSSLFLRNSTVARNQAEEQSGGLDVSPGTRIDHSTIVENVSSGDNSDGIFIGRASPQLRNTILAGNGDSDCLGEGPLVSLGNNLFGTMANCGMDQGQANPNDQTGIEIGLGPLTGTEDSIPGNEHFPPGSLSPAIDAANPEYCVDDPDANGPQLGTDQLGRERTGPCDIGAAEAVCGDAILHGATGEQCDDGNDVNTDTCLNDCSGARCGDGVVQAGVETCDDANEDDDDDCPGNCRSPECGDGAIQAARGEACDDGNKNNEDACLNSCVIASCGDGIVQNNVEACDDGNRINDDACGNNCVEAKCGDSLKQDNEECDDGNQIANDQCTNDCKIFVAVAPTPPPAPVDEEGAAMASDGESSELAQADPVSDEEAGLPDFIEPTNIEGQTVPPPTGGTTGNKPSPTSSESDNGEEEESGGGGGCSLLKIED